MEILTPFLEFNGILRSRGSTKRIILHHSASDTGSAKIIHGWHLGQGWAGIGYHLVINTDGTIEQGRPLDKVGSHSGPAGNVDSIGICLIGNFQNYAPKYKQLEALIWAIKKVREVFGDIPVTGHKDVMATACPGKYFPWEELRRKLLEGVIDMALDKWMIDGGRNALAYLEEKGLVLNAADWGKEEKLAAATPQYLFWMLMQRLHEKMEGK